MAYVAHDESAHAPPAEVEEVELYHPKTFIGKYIWSQDAKVIAVQYSVTAIAVGLVALVLSGIMRLQLGFPHTFSFIDPSNYLQFVTMHGMIMVIYLLTALFLGGLGNYLIPLMVGARDMVFPYVNMVSSWVYMFAVLLLTARTRGMTLMRLPLTVWGIFMATILALLAFPALFVRAVMMLLDLLLGTSFFLPAIVSMGQQLGHSGGSPV